MAAGTRDRSTSCGPTGADDDLVPVRGDVGMHAWISCAASLPWGQPLDQRTDDAWSRCYEWPVDGRVRDPRALRAARRAVTSSDARRVPLGQAVRRVSRRHVGAGDARAAQPHPPGFVGRARGARSWCRRSTSASSWRRRRGSSSRGHRVRLVACGHRLAERVAAAGARDAARRAIVACVLSLPELPGRGTAARRRRSRSRAPERVASGRHVDRAATADRRGASTTTCWTAAATAVVDHGSEFEVSSARGSSSTTTARSACRRSIPATRRRDGDDALRDRVARSDRASPSRGLRFRSDADTYHVEVELDVDDGGEPFARRRWKRDFRRRLQ